MRDEGARGLPGRARVRALGAEVGGFAVAGVCAYVTDVGLFIWLRGPAGFDPLTAKALSFVAACGVAYVGNALGPYRARDAGAGARGRWRRFAVFFLVNLAGAAVQLACLGVSHYGFGLTSARADVIAGAGVGMALATVLRFWGTRTLVFRPPDAPARAR
ncbi:GtrA family protein [Streptomyces iconiensis]|uniref:GtrA family protein n=1 Tax=Streptomyces iconiensis TaxID=1384038 RepID=A0ABT7A9V7_9ACTN|nr:GtrA family protein [Streptomyces iconiensis]MDJ1137591.1 GtrA family protein [Streptomyces iconiensis]